jgi:hypothetical protein
MGLIDGSPRSANVVAAEACELLFLSKDALQRCLQDNFQVVQKLMKTWSCVCAKRIARSRAWPCSMSMGASPACCWICRKSSKGGVWSRKNVEAGYGENDWCIARNGQQGHARSGSERLYRYEDDLLVIPGLEHGPYGKDDNGTQSVAGEDRQPAAGIALAGCWRRRAVPDHGPVGLQSEDPGWSHAVVSSTLHNPTGRAGAWIADLLLYLFGLSAWWWIVLFGMFVWWGIRKFNAPDEHRQHPLFIALGGFHSCCWPVRRSKPCVSIRWRRIAAGAGRPARHRTGQAAGDPVGLHRIHAVPAGGDGAGWSIFSGMSWLWAFEKLGVLLEAGRLLLRPGRCLA